MNRSRLLVHGLLGVCGAAVVVTAAGAFGGGGGLQYHKVVLTGEPVPGTEEGVVFGPLTTALNHAIMSPRIDDDGNVAFIAFISGPDVGEGNQTGIWKETSGELTLVVRTGEPAPGTEDGIVFMGVPSEYLPFPPSFAGGRVSFQGELTGPGVDFSNQSGLWREGANGVELVARQGDPAPDMAPGFSMTAASGEIDDNGRTVLFGSFNGPGVTTNNDEARWSDRTGAMEIVVREGDPAPGLAPGIVIGRGVFGTPTTFGRIAVNGDGRILLTANLLGSGVEAFSDEALYLQDLDTGGLVLVARESDAAPGMAPGVTFGGNSVLASFSALALNGAGQIAFTCRLGGAVPTTSAMYSTHTGVLAPVMQPGDPLPGSSIPFGLFGGPVLSESGVIAFTHATEDDLFFPPFGIYSDRGNVGTIAPVVLPGDTIDLDGAVAPLNGTSGILGLNAAGMLAFAGSVDDPEIGYRSGIFLSDTSGALRAIALTGGVFDVLGDGSDLRDVLRVQGGGMGEDGTVAFRLDFTDVSSGHFSATGDCNGNGIFDDTDITDGVSNDTDGNGVPDECEVALCPGDVDGSGGIGFADLAFLLSQWGPCVPTCTADLDGSGDVGFGDLTVLLSGWGACG